MNKINTLYLVCAYTLIAAFLVFLFIFPETQTKVFLGQAKDYMGDFFNLIYYARDLNPYNFGDVIEYSGDRVYPPIAGMFFYYFSKICPYPDTVANLRTYPQIGLAISTCFFSVCTFVMFYIFEKVSDFKNKFWILLSLALSGLFMFSLERGNLIILTVIFVSLFLFKDKLKLNDNTAILALAGATVLKIVPGLLSLTYLYKKQYKNFFKFLLCFAALFFVPFLFIKGGFQNLFIFLGNLNETKGAYTYFSLANFPFDIKIAMVFVVTALIVAVISLVLNYKVKDEFEQITSLVLSVYFLFTNNGTYVLLLLFPCFILFMNKKVFKKLDYLYLACFLVMFNPLQIMLGEIYLNKTLIKVFAFIFLLALTLNNIVREKFVIGSKAT